MADDPKSPGSWFRWPTGLGEKLILLIATAVVTGVAVPVVNNQRAEAAAVLQARVALIDSIEQTIADNHVRLAAIAWYRSQQPDDARYATARDAYDAHSWQFTSQMHRLLGRVRRLSSPTIYKAFLDDYLGWQRLDQRLVKLLERDQRKDVTTDEWGRFLAEANDQLFASTEVTFAAAREYGLSPR